MRNRFLLAAGLVLIIQWFPIVPLLERPDSIISVLEALFIVVLGQWLYQERRYRAINTIFLAGAALLLIWRLQAGETLDWLFTAAKLGIAGLAGVLFARLGDRGKARVAPTGRRQKTD